MISFMGGMMHGLMGSSNDGVHDTTPGASNGGGAGGQGAKKYGQSPYADFGIRYIHPPSQDVSTRYQPYPMAYPNVVSMQGTGVYQSPSPVQVQWKGLSDGKTDKFQGFGIYPADKTGTEYAWTSEEIQNHAKSDEVFSRLFQNAAMVSFLSGYVKKLGQFDIRRNANPLKKTSTEILEFVAVAFQHMPHIFERFELDAGDTLRLITYAPEKISKALRRDIDIEEILDSRVAGLVLELTVRAVITPTRIATEKNESLFITLLNSYDSTPSKKQFGNPLKEEDAMLKRGHYTNMDLMMLMHEYKLYNYMFTRLFWDYMQRTYPQDVWVYPNVVREMEV